MIKSCYRVVVDLVRHDGTFETRTVRSNIRSYSDVQREIERVNHARRQNDAAFQDYTEVTPRFEPSLAFVA